jgi:Tetratricopeptide repeat
VRTLLVALGLGLALAGCQRAPAPAAVAPVEIVGSLTERLKSEGDELLKKGQYEQAVVKYQEALHQAPGDVPIRFGLAVALSHLSRRDETIEHFRFVVQRGVPGSDEVRIAREWLAGIGEPAEPEPQPTATASSAPPPAVWSPPVSQPGKGRVLGKINWNGIEPRKQRVNLRVTLIGEDTETRDVRLGRPDFKIGRGYEIRDVPPGNYRLLAEVGGTSMWDLKVSVPADKDTTLDLTESNAAAPRDFNPPTE